MKAKAIPTSNPMNTFARLCLAGLSAASTFALATAKSRDLPAFEKLEHGILIPFNKGFLLLRVEASNVVRVAYAKDRTFFDRPSLMVAPHRSPGYVRWNARATDGAVTLNLDRISVRFTEATGLVSFFDHQGRPIISEADHGRSMVAAEVQGDKTFHVGQQWTTQPDEHLYGLGQHQLGLVDIKGYDLDLWQHNGTVVVPFLVSSKGYGILWDNASYSRFGDLRPSESIPADCLFDADGKPGGLTGSYYLGRDYDHMVGRRVDKAIDFEGPASIFPGLPRGDASVRWQGFIQPNESGDYLINGFSDGGIKLFLRGALVMNHWRQSWLPWKDVAKVRLEANQKYPITLEWTKDQGAATFQLQWKTPSHLKSTSLWSEVGEGTDYHFVYGPKLDDVISGYREVTGEASMLPIWAFGMWQSRQRYETQQASLDVIDGFRSRRIPFDNIVQDWFYWKAPEWGSHEFDPARFPDPQGWIDDIHAKHAKLMISVWPKFYPGTANFDALHDKGFLFEPNLKEGSRDWVHFPYTFYDAFSAEARKMYWDQMNEKLFRKHIDAWWMDATEPDLLSTPTLAGTKTHMNPTALGTGSRVLNGYALENAKAVYEGQRSTSPDQRVFILTRSGFAGQQRYAATTWSGDISSTWTAMKKQIAAGLGFSISGNPYCSMDTGGFSVPSRFSSKNAKIEDVEEWNELNARWFEFASFVPLLRVHGEYPFREMWQFGGDSSPTFAAEVKFDRLRYRMLPYIYSMAGSVTRHGDTMMRPLVMDFPNDPEAVTLTDEYMFGRHLLVCPVTQFKARSRWVYLPNSPGWYNVWSGQFLTGGEKFQADAPFAEIPVYARAGTILPLGPELQYTQEKKSDPLTLYIYSGANGAFTLYEDDGVTYGYEKGQHAIIPIRWNDKTRTLTLAKRQGEFSGMLKARTIQVVLVTQDSPTGLALSRPVNETFVYSGEQVQLVVK